MKDARQLISDKVSEHIVNQFGLGDDYVITNFKAKDLSATLTNSQYEVTVKLKGIVASDMQEEISKELYKLQQAKEEAEETEE